jgi:peptidoglycan/xylan/chitin deacetylase (PgdA/CDA1 family)
MVFGTSVPEKPIVITLDDGYTDNYTNALPVLKEFGFKATVFTITGPGPYINADQIKELSDNGIDVEPHTVTHPHLAQLPYSKQIEEMKTSKEYLEKILGKDIKYFAYPYGSFSNDTIKAAQEVGFKMAFNMNGGIAYKQQGIYKLGRIYVGNEYNLDYFKILVNQK